MFIFLELKLLPGLTLYPQNEQEFFNSKGQQDQQRKKRILIYYIGGITYGEIAAIRFLNKLFKDKKFIIATTQVINGETCVEMLRGTLNNNLNMQLSLKK